MFLIADRRSVALRVRGLQDTTDILKSVRIFNRLRDLNLAQEVFDTEFCAERLKALSDPHRLKIVNALRYGELTVGDIAELLDAEVVTVSHHLKIMKYANLVVVRRDGRFMYYKLHDDLQRSGGRGKRFLDLGCCRLEVPDQK